MLRQDIQALRALAVVLVVLWHAGVPGLSGGFVGVDVFFVISGYLMVRILVRELADSGRIGVGRFLHRRARRLLPASLLVLAVTAGLSWLVLPVTSWRSVGWDIVASSLYVVNWRMAAAEVDYLAGENIQSPVQHYWSLAVEEQFYVLLPLALAGTLWAVRRVSRRVRSVRGTAVSVATVTIVALGLGSLVLSLLSARQPSPADYFSTWLRVWELCLGGVLALVAMRTHRRSNQDRARSAAVVAGLALIVASAILITPQDAFPGWIALLPCAGAALVIWADGDDLAVGRPMAARWIQWLGDRSYSLYLWHWPLLVLIDVRLPASPLAKVVAVTGAVVLSAVTFRTVEDRFRLRREIRGARPVRSVAGLVTATACTVSLAVTLSGMAEREPTTLTPALTDASADRFMPFYDGDCRPDVQDPEPKTCSFGYTDSATRVLVVGDSHAVMWMPGLVAAAEQQQWRIDLTAKLSCAPVEATVELDGRPFDACAEWTRNVLRGIEADPPDLVVVAMSPTYQVSGERGSSQDALGRGLRETIVRASDSGSPVVLIAPTPVFPGSVPQCLAQHPDDASACQIPLESSVPANQWPDAVAGIEGAHLLDLNGELCPAGTCLPYSDGILRWMDSNHITATYARTLGATFAAGLAPLI